MVIGGTTDKIQVLKETVFGDGGAGGATVFGVTKNFAWKAETNTQQSYGLETAGPQATANTDGVLSLTGTHEWELVDGRELKAILGTLVDGTGTYNLDVATVLPSYGIKVQDEDNKYLLINGLKYTKFTLKLARGEEPISISADWLAQNIIDTGTFTPTTPSVEPLVYLDGHFNIAGTNQTGIEDISIELDRKCVARRFIEQTATGSRRLISAIVEGPLSIAYNGNMAAQRKVLQEIYGGTTLTDVRSDKTMILRIGRGTMALALTITGSRHASSGRTLDKNQEVSLMDFSGVGLDISGTGSYST